MTWLTITLECCSFVLALWQSHLLAHKNKQSWLVYFIFSIVTTYLFYLKSSYITVINQIFLGITALYPWLYWHKINPKMQKIISHLGWVCLTGSLFLFRFHNLWDWFEVGSWFCIYMKNNLTRIENATGWIYMIAQKIITVIFNILRMNYILALRNFIQLWQAFYGYRKWKIK